MQAVINCWPARLTVVLYGKRECVSFVFDCTFKREHSELCAMRGDGGEFVVIFDEDGDDQLDVIYGKD